jgi:hypothetical protein
MNCTVSRLLRQALAGVVCTKQIHTVTQAITATP